MTGSVESRNEPGDRAGGCSRQKGRRCLVMVKKMLVLGLRWGRFQVEVRQLTFLLMEGVREAPPSTQQAFC